MAKADPERARIVGLAAGIGPMFVAALLLGYFAGGWLDERYGTEPWLMVAGLALGMAAGVLEVVRLVRRMNEAERYRREKRKRRGAGSGEASPPAAS